MLYSVILIDGFCNISEVLFKDTRMKLESSTQ